MDVRSSRAPAVPIPDPMTRRSPAAWAGAVSWCAALGWFAFVRNTRVPLLSLADLGFHELGHMVMYVVPVSELLAAAIDLETGNPGQGVSRLKKLVALQPDNLKARRLLAAAQWRTGDAAATVATLRPLADAADADSYSLTLMGNALARLGNGAASSRYLTRAAQPQANRASLLGAPADPVRLATLRAEAVNAPDDAAAQVDLIRGLLSAGLGDEALARAFELQSRNPGAPDAHLLVGDALGIQGRFAEAAEHYRKAAMLILPSLSEGFGLALVEALGCECPVIASDLPGTREIIQAGVTGQLVPPGDEIALSAAIIDVLEHSDRARTMAQLGRVRCLERFDWSSAAANYRSLFTGLLDHDA